MWKMDLGIQGKSAIICASSRGLGKACASSLAANGVNIVLNGREQKILNGILQSEFRNRCVALDQLDLLDILPIIRNCKISVCNDSSFSHLSAAVGIQTIVLMADTPMLYGSYSPSMHPIIPDGELSVTHDTLGKDKINPDKIFKKFKEILV